MKTTLTLLFTTSALTVALGLPAFAALHASGSATEICGNGVCAMRIADGDQTLPLIRVSGDDTDDADEGDRVRRGHDEDCDDDEGDDSDGQDCTAASGAGNRAPAGTVAPPANGLFGNGAPPVAVTN